MQRTQSLQQSASHQTVEQEKSRRLSLAEDSSCTQRSLHQQITRRKSLAEDYFKELDGESPEAYDSPRPVLTTDRLMIRTFCVCLCVVFLLIP